jgi:hypothetical protein
MPRSLPEVAYLISNENQIFQGPDNQIPKKNPGHVPLGSALKTGRKQSRNLSEKSMLISWAKTANDKKNKKKALFPGASQGNFPAE